MEVRAAWLIFIACFLIGTSQGLGQFYRFAATDICDDLSFTISPMTGGCPAPAGMVEPWGKSVSSTSV